MPAASFGPTSRAQHARRWSPRRTRLHHRLSWLLGLSSLCSLSAILLIAAPAWGFADRMIYDRAAYPLIVSDVDGSGAFTDTAITPAWTNSWGIEIALSPDGQTIAYQSIPSGGSLLQASIVLSDAHGQSQRTVLSDGWNLYGFDPSGTKLLVGPSANGAPCPGLCSVNIDGTGLTTLFTAPGMSVEGASYSPDGTQIVWSGYTSKTGTNNLYIANADGSSPRQLTSYSSRTNPSEVSFPAWGPNNIIAFAGLTQTGTTLFTIPSSGGKSTNLGVSNYGNPMQPAWDPSSGRVAVVDDNCHIELVPPTGGTPFINSGLCTNTVAYRKVSTSLGFADYEAAHFMPIVDFDSTEKWRPLNIPMFLAEQDPSSGQPWNQICDPSPSTLCQGLTGEGTMRAFPTTGSYIAIHNSGGDPDSYQSPNAACHWWSEVGAHYVYDCDTGAASAMYYHVSSQSPGGFTYIEYFLFYRYNQGLDNIGNHAGDWEGVAVAPDTGSDTFEFAEFSQHGGWDSFLRDNLECDNGGSGSCGSESGLNYYGQHVMSFPASGSHANYPGPGTASFDNSNDGAAPWARNLNASLAAGACPSNVPATPPETCGPALIALPPTAAEGAAWTTGPERWTDWYGMWGDTGASCAFNGGCGLGDSNSPTSPAAPAPEDHGPHYFAPWSGTTCQSGGACPARVPSTAPLACANWFGIPVVVLACDPSTMHLALRRHWLTRRGTLAINLASSNRHAATAPGLSQLLGRPLRPGEHVSLSGSMGDHAELWVRAIEGRRLVTVVFWLGGFRQRGTIRVSRGRRGYPAVLLVSGRTRIAPSRGTRQLVPAGAVSR